MMLSVHKQKQWAQKLPTARQQNNTKQFALFHRERIRVTGIPGDSRTSILKAVSIVIASSSASVGS
jgi:hypothetical protein